jgi:hypothetical protein
LRSVIVRFSVIIAWFGNLPDPDKVALIALAGVLVTASITFVSSRRSIYINSVTTERSKWINALRINIAEFSKYALTLQGIKKQGLLSSKDAIELIERLNGLMSLIKLQLNPRGEMDANISKILDKFAQANLGKIDLERAHNLLIEHSQWLLKAEWERVKYEASGFVRGFVVGCKRKIHGWRYHTFAIGEGRVD